MYVKKIGPVEIIIGENSSRTPFSTSLAIKGKHDSILIDCGSGMEAFKYIQTEHNIDKIYLTHHHIDHTWGAYLFPNAKKFINPLDSRKSVDIQELVRAQGFKIFI